MFESKRLLFRDIVPADIEHIYRGLSDPLVNRHYGVRFSTQQATQEQMDWFADNERKGTGKWWTLWERSNSEFCGAIGFSSWDQQHKKAEIGLWIVPPFWGRGYLYEAMEVVCDYAFSGMRLHRIEGFVESGNTKCIQAMAKTDFQYEGTMRDCEVKDGEFVSVRVYALINPAVS